MFVIIGFIIVAFSVFGGFVIAGGHVAALFQPVELLMIGGAATGAFLVGNSNKVISATLKALPKAFKGSKYTKQLSLDLLALLFELLNKTRRDGLLSIEADIEAPAKSEIFKKYPTILSEHHLMDFIIDYLRMMVGGAFNPMEMESLMDVEIETHHHEAELPSNALSRMGDAMPAFGIVAAVMGVVHTMESLHLPPKELGVLIAHALVGTFLGILLSYGFVGPLAPRLSQGVSEESKMLECIKVTILASLSGYVPQVAVEFGRKTLFSTERPTFRELEEGLKKKK
ncbi:MAG: flagellar motor stator protein MotA [Desulfobulbaceae bacterium A2]|nr:MAG: flagellar motor stator protein MotA [Desulfobulbaceae bacterium A2]